MSSSAQEKHRLGLGLNIIIVSNKCHEPELKLYMIITFYSNNFERAFITPVAPISIFPNSKT
jgi:hypothetical protein